MSKNLCVFSDKNIIIPTFRRALSQPTLNDNGGENTFIPLI